MNEWQCNDKDWCEGIDRDYRRLANDEFDEDVIRAFQLLGRLVSDEEFPNTRKRVTTYAIGGIILKSVYCCAKRREQLYVVLVVSVIPYVLVGLRIGIEAMLAELDETCEVVAVPGDLEPNASVDNTFNVAWNVLKKVKGVTCMEGIEMDTGNIMVVASLDGIIAAKGAPTKRMAIQGVTDRIGSRIVRALLKEYDELVKRCCSPERVTEQLFGTDEVIACASSDAAEAETKKRKL